MTAERERIDAALDSILSELLQDVPDAIREPIAYAVRGGGKRLRPALCLAAYRAVAERNAPEGAVRVACALEIIHTYSLVHDDLPCMDNDDLRRGQPTAHRVFGTRAATLAGAAMIPLAFRVLRKGAAAMELDAGRVAQLEAVLARAAGADGMVGGQVLDLAADAQRADLESLERIHAAKTGALLTAAPRLGGLMAGAQDEQAEALAEYGRALGLAFQIADDVLDVTASTAVLGKTGGKDAATGKATFVALLGLADARARAELEARRAVQQLEAVGLATEELRGLAVYVVQRER